MKQVDFDGSFSYSPEVEVAMTSPKGFVLESAYPNPFNPRTQLTFVSDVATNVRATLYNALGLPVRVLFDGPAEAHKAHVLTVDGAGLPSGPYIVKVEGASVLASRSLVLVK